MQFKANGMKSLLDQVLQCGHSLGPQEIMKLKVDLVDEIDYLFMTHSSVLTGPVYEGIGV
jgi:hypothetical protein